MASKKTDASDDKKGYQPKATARHAKMTQTKKDEIETLKAKIDTDKYLAKKYEANRKTEIKALPKEERAAAKTDLKESIAKRKEAEKKDREKLRDLMQEERVEKVNTDKEVFDEDAWVKGGRKKSKGKETSDAKTKPEDVPDTPKEPVKESAPEQTATSEKKD